MAYQGYDELVGGAATGGALALVQRTGRPNDFSDQQVEIIRSTIAPGVDDAQLALFIEVAKRTGLDPFSRQIYAILRNASEKDAHGKWQSVKKMTIQTGIDGYRAIAARTRQLAGIDDAVFDTEDAEHPNKATVTVWRLVGGQRVPFTASARWSEYAQLKDEYDGDRKTGRKVLTDMWARMPYGQLGKCAEALALRKGFPNEMGGIYTTEEMGQVDNSPVTVAPETIRHGGHAVNVVTGEVVLSEAEVKHERTQAATQAATQAREGFEPARTIASLRPRMRAQGIVTQAQADSFCRAHLKKTWGAVTEEDYDALDAAITRDEAKVKAAMAADGARALSLAPDDDEPAEQDNGDPDALRNAPELQGSVRP